jgi:hypothetical protein
MYLLADRIGRPFMPNASALVRVDSEPPSSTWAAAATPAADPSSEDELEALLRSIAKRASAAPDPRNVRSINALATDEIAALAAKPAPDVLSPVVPADGLTLLHGPRGIGLTRVAIGMAMAMASGSEFLGWRAFTPARVLLIGGTMPAAALARRVAEAQRALPPGADIGDRLDMVAMGDKANTLPNLAVALARAELEALTGDIEVVVIDDLAGLLPGGRLDARGSANLQYVLARWRSEGKSVVVTQATGRDRALRVGHEVVQRVADVVLRLARPGDHEPGTEACFELWIERARNFAGAARPAFEARLATGIDGRPAWHTTPLDVTREQRFASLLGSGMTVEQACEEIGISRATGYRWKGPAAKKPSHVRLVAVSSTESST